MANRSYTVVFKENRNTVSKDIERPILIGDVKSEDEFLKKNGRYSNIASGRTVIDIMKNKIIINVYGEDNITYSVPVKNNEIRELVDLLLQADLAMRYNNDLEISNNYNKSVELPDSSETEKINPETSWDLRKSLSDLDLKKIFEEALVKQNYIELRKEVGFTITGFHYFINIDGVILLSLSYRSKDDAFIKCFSHIQNIPFLEAERLIRLFELPPLAEENNKKEADRIAKRLLDKFTDSILKNK